LGRSGPAPERRGLLTRLLAPSLLPQLCPDRAEHGCGKGPAVGDGHARLIHQLVRQAEADGLEQRAPDFGVLLELRTHRLLGERVVFGATRLDTLATEHDRVVGRGARSGALRLEAPEREHTITVRGTLRKLQPLPKPLDAVAADLARTAPQSERRLRERGKESSSPIL